MMNRLDLRMVQNTYGYPLSEQEYADLVDRDATREHAGKPKLFDLLYDTYYLDNIEIYKGTYGHGISFRTISWYADEDTLNLIANEIDQYIAGVENFWTGEDA